MSDKKIFGLSEEQIRRQSGKGTDVDPESRMGPINPDDGFLDPCIRGSQKILDDPEKREMFYRIYRGKKKTFIERLTDEQIRNFLNERYPKAKSGSCIIWRYKNYIQVSIDGMRWLELHDMGVVGDTEPGRADVHVWIKYLYKIFGEEYKEAYLANCAKIFD